jgi:hypothetical protein
MLQQRDRQRSDNGAGTPWWKRITALFTLSSLVVVAGIVMAAAIATTALLLLFVVERAISG